MGTITVSVELPAAPEKVWAILSSPAQFENWLTIHTKWKSDLPAELATGQHSHGHVEHNHLERR